MASAAKSIEVYLESGKKRTIAGVLDWPGWCRAGGDEDEALAALCAAGQRYAAVLHAAGMTVRVPADSAAFDVVERLTGKTATDIGVPVMPPSRDADPIGDKELGHLQDILRACWKALDKAARRAEGKTLRLGPRGGGRSLAKILEHVRGAEQGYLTSLGGKAPNAPSDKAVRQIILDTLEASAHGEVPAKGPRGGKRWSARYCVRRMAWHILDHIWEIEDRMGD